MGDGRAPSCPACGSAQILRIVYGEPTIPTFEAAERGEVVIGGCLLGRESPVWSCRACKQTFGRLDEADPGLFKEKSDG